MTPHFWFPAVSILGTVNLMSLMIEFEVDVKKALVWVGLGTLVVLGINLMIVPKWIALWGKSIYVLTLIVPIYGLFYPLSKTKGLRYAYTFVFCLSFTVLLDTLALVLIVVTRNPILTEILCLGLLMGFDGVLILKVRSIYFEVQKHKDQDWALFLLIPLLGLTLLFILFEQPLNLTFPIKHLELKLIALLILSVSHSLIFLNFIKFFDLLHLEEHNRILEEMLVHMREDLSSMIEKIRETQLHRHDLHHHLAVLSACAHQHNLAEFDAYVLKLRHKLDDIAIELVCPHFSINAVLSVYLKKALDHQIHITKALCIPDFLPLKDIDLALILANGLENAIHANQKVPLERRFIDLRIDSDAVAMTIILSNPYEGPIDFMDGLPQSSIEHHGYGTLSIFALAKRNGGFARFSAKKGRFTLIVQNPY